MTGGIRRVLALLEAHGFDIIDSDDGTDVCACCNNGFVAIQITPDDVCFDADRLREVLIGAGVAFDQEESPVIASRYNPAERELAYLEVAGICDAMLATVN